VPLQQRWFTISAMDSPRNLPLVLAIGGHDPSGGAGIQADIETLAANGCRSLTVVTALTTQNTCAVRRVLPQPAGQVTEQVRLLLDESTVAAMKIGLIGSAGTALALAELLRQHPGIPVVLDPVLASGSGTDLADGTLPLVLEEALFPCCTLITPNSDEARRLSSEQDLDAAATRLIRHGCASVLITGTHESAEQVTNRLYSLGGPVQSWDWPRLPGSYHGSGCTLASAIAAGLARGLALHDAVQRAQQYTWDALDKALSTGRCQFTPDRFHRFITDA
jgi:hydroxymethylpyrimidine/phosphomethylpyrimidine kinase